MDEKTLHDCRRAALRTVQRLAAGIASDGSLGQSCQDLACFYKPPYLMQLAGHAQQAQRLLEYIHDRFLHPDGVWMADQPARTRMDQSAEAAIWLLEIAALGWTAGSGDREPAETERISR